ncbi:MAG TPA: mechanosensitive ion channel family protein, partial [Chryseolinea sp.]|nr:mechanosensitive ion channel family protein [Chryseolinea sp.]
NYQWQYLRDILDFLLDRRRTMELQRKILNHKINKELEVLDFFMKGEAFAILEATVEKGWQDANAVEDEEALDPADTNDTTANPVVHEQKSADEFNWSVIELERELQVLEARFEVSRKTWLFLEQLLALNEDDHYLAKSLADKSSGLLVKWESNLKSMQQNLDELMKSDSATSLEDDLRKSLSQVAPLALRMKNRGVKDSLLASDLEMRMTRLKARQDPLSEKVRDASKNIEKKKRRLQFMTSPFAPHRIMSFLVNNGPRILFIMLMFLLLYLALHWFIKAVLPKFRFKRYKSIEEQQERIETLSRALRSGITIIILIVAGLTLLSEFGIDVSVLLGGAAVFSLAIAFGAQSLIKDYFSGVMIISENQYRVGNVVNINNVSGVVEDITLRMTILRDVEGVVHFIPHGEIKVVSNLGYGWSQIALDVKIAYTENVDYVMSVIMEVALELRKDPSFGKYIIKEPELLGVDSFADSSLIIKILVKTPPLKQWIVKRELLRRIKNRFDEEGIEIPLPYQKIYYTSGEGIIPHSEKIKEQPSGKKVDT